MRWNNILISTCLLERTTFVFKRTYLSSILNLKPIKIWTIEMLYSIIEPECFIINEKVLEQTIFAWLDIL